MRSIVPNLVRERSDSCTGQIRSLRSRDDLLLQVRFLASLRNDTKMNYDTVSNGRGSTIPKVNDIKLYGDFPPLSMSAFTASRPYGVPSSMAFNTVPPPVKK